MDRHRALWLDSMKTGLHVPAATLSLAFTSGLTACQQGIPVGEWELVRRGDIEFPWDNSYLDCTYVVEGAMSIKQNEWATLTLDYDRSGDCYYGTGHTTLTYEGIAIREGEATWLPLESTSSSSIYEFQCVREGEGLECTEDDGTVWVFE